MIQVLFLKHEHQVVQVLCSSLPTHHHPDLHTSVCPRLCVRHKSQFVLGAMGLVYLINSLFGVEN